MGECLAFPKYIEAEDSPLIPQGVYEMAYVEHSTWMFKGRQPKVVISFRIIDPGDYFGAELKAYYNAKELIGKRGKAGRFRLAKKSYLARDYCRVFHKDPAPRLDRVPLSKLKSVIVQGTVQTVKTDAQQRMIPKTMWYSRVLSIDG